MYEIAFTEIQNNSTCSNFMWIDPPLFCHHFTVIKFILTKPKNRISIVIFNPKNAIVYATNFVIKFLSFMKSCFTLY